MSLGKNNKLEIHPKEMATFKKTDPKLQTKASKLFCYVHGNSLVLSYEDQGFGFAALTNEFTKFLIHDQDCRYFWGPNGFCA